MLAAATAALDPIAQAPAIARLTRRAAIGAACVAMTLVIAKTGAWWTTDSVAMLSSLEIGRAHAELQSLMRISYAVFCLKKKKQTERHAKDIQKYCDKTASTQRIVSAESM